MVSVEQDFKNEISILITMALNNYSKNKGILYNAEKGIEISTNIFEKIKGNKNFKGFEGFQFKWQRNLIIKTIQEVIDNLKFDEEKSFDEIFKELEDKLNLNIGIRFWHYPIEKTNNFENCLKVLEEYGSFRRLRTLRYQDLIKKIISKDSETVQKFCEDSGINKEEIIFKSQKKKSQEEIKEDPNSRMYKLMY